MKMPVVTAFAAGCAFAAVVNAEMTPLGGMGDVRLKGYLGERLDAMIERNVAGKDVDYITEAFLEKTESHGWWQTEFWGKWMHSAVPYARYLENGGQGAARSIALKNSIERGIERILASQEPSGYIGNYPDEFRCGDGWDVWGMKYTLMGLLHYYDAKQETGNREQAQRALEAAKRLCDYVIAEIGPGGRRGRELWQTGNWTGYASSSILEPVVWLYRRIRLRQDFGGQAAAKKYLDFAAYIVKGMSEPEAGPRLIDLALKGVAVADRNGYGNKAEENGEYVRKTSRIKAYEMMSCYQGLLEYVEVKREELGVESGGIESGELKNIMKAAVMAAEDIAKEEINLAGGCACNERWFHGAHKQHIAHARLQETCVTITWMRLCEKLLDMTGDTKWADRLEQTFYNAYLAALKADGSEFTSYTPLTGNRWHGMNHCFMHEDCCNSNGPRGFLCFLHKFFTTDGDAATFNFYSSALVKGELSGGRKTSFEMYSLYPRVNTIRIVSRTGGAGKFPLRLRIPAWSANTIVKLNGKALDGAAPGGYFAIEREWKLGDIVEIAFDMPVVAHVMSHFVAFTRGPILLARDSRFGDGDLCEALHTDVRFGGGVKDGEVRPTFVPVRSPSDDMWMAFSATLPIGAHYLNPEGSLPVTVSFCDYASAGNAWTRENNYRTWMPVESGPND